MDAKRIMEWDRDPEVLKDKLTRAYGLDPEQSSDLSLAVSHVGTVLKFSDKQKAELEKKIAELTAKLSDFE